MTRQILLIIILAAPVILQGQEGKLNFEYSHYSGEYLGLKHPHNKPLKFAPGFISVDNEYTHCLIFSPDGNHLVYTWADSNWKHWGMFYSKRVGNKWLKPTMLKYKECDKIPFNPTFSNDSKYIIFTMVSTEWPDTDLYTIELSDSGYSAIPKRMDTPINTDMIDFGYFIDKDSSIYFTGKRNDFMGGLFDIYVCKKENGNYITQNLSILNSSLDDASPYISPDGTYLIYEQMVNETGIKYNDSTARIIRIDLFISFRDMNNNWSKPINLGPRINSKKYKTYRPVITPDGKYLFYSQTEKNGAGVYWVSTRIIEKLKHSLPKTLK